MAAEAAEEEQSFKMNEFLVQCIIIGLEILAIAALLYFVMRWSKEYKAWKAEKEETATKKEEDELLKKLSNSRRTQ